MATSTLKDADQAFARGDHQTGLTLLRHYSRENSEDAAHWHRLAIVEEQVGDWDKAGLAHYRCLQLAANNPTAYLYAGYWLQTSQSIEASAACYSLAFELLPDCLFWWQNKQKSEPTRLRSQQAHSLLPTFLSEHHRNPLKGRPNVTRIHDAVWPITHDKPVNYPSPFYRPEVFYIPELRQQAFYAASEFTWTKAFCQTADSIQQELFEFLRDNKTNTSLRPYLSASQSVPKNLSTLKGSLDWSALDLFKDGVLNKNHARHFPQTLEAIKQVPTYNEGTQPFEVFFSALNGGQSINQHFGQSNHALTAHLALKIPRFCEMVVADQTQHWNEKELLMFDDSFRHSAHNNSSEQRIVLIFSIWHPDLTETEKSAVKSAFQTRRNWLERRRKLLAQLTHINTQ